MSEVPLYDNLIFLFITFTTSLHTKAHRLLYHSILDLIVIKKKKKSIHNWSICLVIFLARVLTGN